MGAFNNDKSIYDLIVNTTMKEDHGEEKVVLQTLRVRPSLYVHSQHEYENSGIQSNIDPRVVDAQNAIQSLQYEFVQVVFQNTSLGEYPAEFKELFCVSQSTHQSRFV